MTTYAYPSLEAWLFTFLTTDEAVAEIVGTRVYEEVVPQGAAYPAITYTTIGGERGYTLNNTNRQAINRVQVSVWAQDGIGRRRLADAVAARLDGYRGTLNGKTVQSVFLDGELNVYEKSPGNEAQRLFGKHFDFEITHEIETTDRA